MLKGTGAGFEPHAKVSHAMLWQMIYQLAGEPELSTSADAISNDAADAISNDAAGAAPAQPWYAVARSWCLDAGIISSSGSRDPDAPAQRREFVHALYRSHLLLRDANPEACADLDAFSDASDMDSRAAAAFRWAVGSGIIEGDIDVEGGRILRPGSDLSRAELAAILYRYGTL